MCIRRISRHWPPPLFFLLILIVSIQGDEREVLLNFKSAVGKSSSGSDLDVFNSWTEENSPCNFTGIVCNSGGSVSQINLPQQNLSGVLQWDAICSLKSLQKIDLGKNSLNGSVTEDLKNCTELQYLDLGVNSFSGEVPDLSSLQSLKLLNFNASGFSGKFPWNSLENLTDLTFLSLGDNPFDPSPFPEEVTKFQKLYWLYLTNCSITGKIPEGISNLILLENLELAYNHLSGEIPAGIVKLSKLWQLELYYNNLTGKIPSGFGNLSNLKNFDASQNHLSGDLSELRSLQKIESLQLFENQLSGEIPTEFGEFKNLKGFSVYRNRLTGQLPPKIGSWADFEFIDVSENFLTGPIPPDMCKNGKMFDFLLLQNKMTGEIPASYADCKSLERLRINNNSFSGTVPAGIWGLPNLSVLDLTMNQFEGPVIEDIGNAKNLGLLLLSNNQFSGELPAALSQASSLISIQLTSNRFSGQIPATIGELKTVSTLSIDENMFSGTIPESLGSCVKLAVMNLAGNKLSGQIPASLGSLHNLNSLNLSRNQLSGAIPNTLSLKTLSLLDLSNNQLVGPIPESLSIQAFRYSFLGNPGLCSSSLNNFRSCSSYPRRSTHFRVILSCFIAGTMVMIISLACYMFVKFRPSELDHPLRQGSWDMKSYRVLSFTEKDIIDAVKSENLIGKGGCGNVYKAMLADGKELAVKHIWTTESGNQKSGHSSAAILTKRSARSLEYDAEVATLSATRHVNVVKLYCSITSEDSNLLVYEYLPNGSLWERLHTCNDKIAMDWDVRYAVALGSARGLEYLHHGCDRPVIHRDVKSSNILLDEEWKPRLADFGLAKILQSGAGGEWTQVIAGTHGYMAPEYAYTYKVNEKSDVYSFGVVLLELVTGKRPVEPEFGENKDIVQWIYNQMRIKERMVDVVDTSISEASKEEAVKVLRIAVHCTAKVPGHRPSMRMVVKMLEEAQPCHFTGVFV